MQRSVDGRQFQTIGEVPSLGNNQAVQAYHWLDETPFSGINYYRIQQVDIDGATSYSDIQQVDLREEQTSEILIYPNPATDWLAVKGVSEQEVAIYDAAGQLVRQLDHQDDQHILITDLPNGSYYLQVLGTEGKRMIPWVKLD